MGRPIQTSGYSQHHPYQKPSSESDSQISFTPSERGYTRLDPTPTERSTSLLAPGSMQRRRLMDASPASSFINLGNVFSNSLPSYENSRRNRIPDATGPVRRNSDGSRICQPWEHPRRKLLELEIESENASRGTTASQRTQERMTRNADISVDDLEEMIIRQLRPRALNMLFGGSVRNAVSNGNPDSAIESNTTSTLEAMMERLRRQVRIQQQLLDEPPPRRYTANRTPEESENPLSISTSDQPNAVTFTPNSRFRSAVFPRPYENVSQSTALVPVSRSTVSSASGNTGMQIMSDTFYRWSMVRRPSASNNASQQRSSSGTGAESGSFRSSIPIPSRTIPARQGLSDAPSTNSTEEPIFVRRAWDSPDTSESTDQTRHFAPAWPFERFPPT